MKKLLVLILILFACNTNNKKTSQNNLENEKSPDNILWDYDTIVTNREIRKYKLWSGRVEIYNFTKKFYCNDSLIVTFYDELNQDAKNWVHSQKGVWNQNSNNFQAIENVIVINFKGHILKTDTLFYDNKNEKIYSNTNVMFYNNLDTLYGTSFISNIDLSEIDIKNATAVSSRKK